MLVLSTQQLLPYVLGVPTLLCSDLDRESNDAWADRACSIRLRGGEDLEDEVIPLKVAQMGPEKPEYACY